MSSTATTTRYDGSMDVEHSAADFGAQLRRHRETAGFTQEELAEIARKWEPRPWATGQRNLVVRVPWTEVTGRQLGGGWDPWQHLPVSRLA